MARKPKPPNRFRWFGSSPEVIRLVVMLYVKYPLSLRNVEDLLHERGIDICHETVRLWWTRFGPMFANEIRKKRVEAMREHTHWRWRLDEVYVRTNGGMRYLWRAVDHDGRLLPDPTVEGATRRQTRVRGSCYIRDECRRTITLDLEWLTQRGLGRALLDEVRAHYRCRRTPLLRANLGREPRPGHADPGLCRQYRALQGGVPAVPGPQRPYSRADHCRPGPVRPRRRVHQRALAPRHADPGLPVRPAHLDSGPAAAGAVGRRSFLSAQGGADAQAMTK